MKKIKQAIAPYQAKQRFKTYQLGDQVQGFKVINTAGHTPGHFSYELKTKDETVVFIGDIVHSHTVQFDKPETAIDYDIDPKKSGANPLKAIFGICKRRANHCSTTLAIPCYWTYLFSRWKKLSMDSCAF